MLLDDLITKLSDESQSITDILLKTKVLLADIDQQDLVQWVNRELNGYSDSDDLPDYRILPSEVRANLAAMTFTAEAHPIPLGHLTKEQRKHLDKLEVRDGLSVVERLHKGSDGPVRRHLPMENNRILSKGLAQGVRVNSAWVETSPIQLADISAQVRSRLLDFMLQLRTKVGRAAPDEEIKTRSVGFDAAGAFQHTVFSGPTNIIVGHQATQNIQQKVAFGDWTSLKHVLEGVDIPSEDIAALKAAVDEDQNLLGAPTLEGATGRWYTGILGKIGKGTLKTSLNVATSVIGAALGHFLGINS